MSALGLALLVLVLGVTSTSGDLRAEEVNPLRPVRYIHSCELDFDGDGRVDIAEFIESRSGHELIILLRRSDGFLAFRPFAVAAGERNYMMMECRLEDSFVGIPPGGKPADPRQRYKTPGAYILMYMPESSSVAYFYQDGRVREVWTSD